MSNNSLQTINIENRILVIRGQQVMFDLDLVEFAVWRPNESFSQVTTHDIDNYVDLSVLERFVKK